MILTDEQQRAYDKYIKARDKVGLVRRKGEWVRLADVIETFDDPKLNHPLFVQNDAWLEYKQAFVEWLAVEPKCREQERMRMTRGDYGVQDNWLKGDM